MNEHIIPDALKVPLDGCETSLNAEGNLENAVVIQESSTHVQPSDKKYLLTCIPAASSTRFVLSYLRHFCDIYNDFFGLSCIIE